MHVEEILAQLVSFPVLGGQSNMSILNWIKEHLNSHGIESYLVPNKENNKAPCIAGLGLQ